MLFLYDLLALRPMMLFLIVPDMFVCNSFLIRINMFLTSKARNIPIKIGASTQMSNLTT